VWCGQRVLLSTKASYRAFARKHEVARLNLRKKETMVRALEVTTSSLTGPVQCLVAEC
jgi:hypothetical protein